MFRRNWRIPDNKPDPPVSCEVLLIGLILVCTTGFALSVSRLNAINANTAHERKTKSTQFQNSLSRLIVGEFNGNNLLLFVTAIAMMFLFPYSPVVPNNDNIKPVVKTVVKELFLIA
ncbi:MAG: hypothetical protein WBM32_04700 [Crocosphaera sp.]|jgi:hypothetical protein